MNRFDVAALSAWMFDDALPLWQQRSVDLVWGGVREELALDGGMSDPGFKRVRVPARQIYVYSHASLLGWEHGLGEAKQQFDKFVETAWQGPDTGWAKRLNSDNSIADPTIDLYDNAFAIFGLAWYYRASGEGYAKDLIHETFRLIDQNLRHPKVGFWHQVPTQGPRIQNPHMHLLEACLACLENFHDPLIERIAREVINLFQTKFFDANTGTLGEYFDDDLTRLTGDAYDVVEPGHQMEWAWILSKAQTRLGIDLRNEAQSLVKFAEFHGVCRAGPMAGATYNSVRTNGEIRDGGSRTWPNTERLKSAIAMFELFGREPGPIINETLNTLFTHHLAHPIKGLWYDSFDQSGAMNATAIPTSTFYHIFLAFAEVMRVSPILENDGKPE
jgi:mannose/cellobiose epimerase-like protein (N-acyl-D-glucosamine 2-epimerase family)